MAAEAMVKKAEMAATKLEEQKKELAQKKKEMERAKKSAVKARLSTIRHNRGGTSPASYLNGPTAPTESPKHGLDEGTIGTPSFDPNDETKPPPAKIPGFGNDDDGGDFHDANDGGDY